MRRGTSAGAGPRAKVHSRSEPREPSRREAREARGPVTLAIDVGGTGIKALLLDPHGEPLTERARVATPRPATPARVLEAILELVRPLGDFDRVSVGFPGVVVGDTVRTAPNLDGRWKGFPIARVLSLKLGRPVRALNDAGVQGYGVIEGKGTEMVLTLGTGMGTALYADGHYVPNLELAHHPFRGKKTYEDYVGGRALAKIGKAKWNRRVQKVIAQIDPVWNPRRIYLGGGNARHLRLALPRHVSVTENVAGLLGGIALWRD
ncbi:MAG: ROK family protein [Labilithrix sp.]|nr:ROK family protein [Labilithrix sp.]